MHSVSDGEKLIPSVEVEVNDSADFQPGGQIHDECYVEKTSGENWTLFYFLAWFEGTYQAAVYEDLRGSIIKNVSFVIMYKLTP